MLARLARFAIHRKRRVALGALLFVVLAGALGGNVAQHLSNGGFQDPAAESSRAKEELAGRFGTGVTNLVVLVRAKNGTVDDPAVVAAATGLVQRLAAEPGVTSVASYWTLGNASPLKNTKGDKALVLGTITGSEDAVRDRIEELGPAYRTDGDVIASEVTGQAEIFRQVGATIESDLKKAELIALPITLVLLVLIFGSVVAASLPLAIGILSVMGTFLVLRTLAAFTEVSIFSLNLTTAMGLGLAIDYSLFVVSRYREELRAGHAPNEAIVRTVRTAGRTVAFSAATVGISLAALLVFPLSFLRSFAYAGIAVAVMTALGAIVVLPALLALLGRRVNALKVRNVDHADTGIGIWHRVAMAVMRRPIGVATAVIGVLLLLGVPFLHLDLGLSDYRVLPSGASSRTTQETIVAEFGSLEAGATEVVLPNTASGDGAAVSPYAAALSRIDGVARVDAASGSYIAGQLVAPPVGPVYARFAGASPSSGTWLSVVPSIQPVSPEGERMAKAIRAVEAPSPGALVGGPSARLVDEKHAVFGRMPLAGVIIAIVTFTVLFLMFGGVLVPLKALVLNLLSLTATFGAMVWIFQDGHFSGALDFTATGTIDTTMPILMFCIAFGLSMDYEVFLLSRIKEEHDRGASNTDSVAMGLEHTGRIVTAAAVLIAVVFGAFATSGITFIKLFGIGLALAVLMDAFLIRATLVPAFMRLAGNANWWAPAPLRRIHDRFGISEHVDLDDGPAVVPPADGTVDLRVTADTANPAEAGTVVG